MSPASPSLQNFCNGDKILRVIKVALSSENPNYNVNAAGTWDSYFCESHFLPLQNGANDMACLIRLL